MRLYCDVFFYRLRYREHASGSLIANTRTELGEWHSRDITDKSRRIGSLCKIITDYLQ